MNTSQWDVSGGLSVPGSHAVPAQNRRRGEGGVRPQLEMQYLRPVGCRLPPSSLTASLKSQGQVLASASLPAASSPDLIWRIDPTSSSYLHPLLILRFTPLIYLDLSLHWNKLSLLELSPPPSPPPPPNPNVSEGDQSSPVCSPAGPGLSRITISAIGPESKVPSAGYLKCKLVHQLGLNKPQRW